MRLGRVAGQTTESEAGGGGSAWIGVFDKGTERRASTKFGRVWIRSAEERHGQFGWHATSSGSKLRSLQHPPISTVLTLSADSPPSAWLTEIIPMLPSAKSSQHLLF
jgi:hypothetical protein